MKIKFHIGCPYCGDTAPKRLRRKKWMKIFMGSRHFEYKVCGRRFVEILGITIGLGME